MYECCLHTLPHFLDAPGLGGRDRARSGTSPCPGVTRPGMPRPGAGLDQKGRLSRSKSRRWATGPTPYAHADALMYADGKPIVRITDMSVRMGGTDRARVEALWKKSAPAVPGDALRHGVHHRFRRRQAFRGLRRTYKVFDRERVIARLPGPPYQFLDRITEIEGLQACGSCAPAA